MDTEPGDVALMEASLEAAAEACEDLSPAVYARFFAARPDAQPLFRLGQRTRGRMLNEIISILFELARGHAYMPATIETLVKDHDCYGNIPLDFHRDLLESLVGVLAELLEGAWTPEVAAAWRAQTSRLLDLIAHDLGPADAGAAVHENEKLITRLASSQPSAARRYSSA